MELGPCAMQAISRRVHVHAHTLALSGQSTYYMDTWTLSYVGQSAAVTSLHTHGNLNRK